MRYGKTKNVFIHIIYQYQKSVCGITDYNRKGNEDGEKIDY